MSDGSIHVVFAEEDTLFRLMEMGLKRKLTPEGEKTLRYFFGSEFSTSLEALTTMADRLGLPAVIDTTVCENEPKLDHILPTADFVVVEASTLSTDRVKACAPKTRLIQQFGRAYRNIDVATARALNIPVANLTRLSSQSSADHVTALILALARNLLAAHRAVTARRDPTQSGTFAKDPPRNKFNWAGNSRLPYSGAQHRRIHRARREFRLRCPPDARSRCACSLLQTNASEPSRRESIWWNFLRPAR